MEDNSYIIFIKLYFFVQLTYPITRAPSKALTAHLSAIEPMSTQFTTHCVYLNFRQPPCVNKALLQTDVAFALFSYWPALIIL